MNEDLKYKVALSMLPNIGGILARNLVAYIGSAEGVFSQSAKALTKVPGIGETYARQIKKNNVLPKAEKELEYIDKNGIDIHFYTDVTYPRRLKSCIDAPLIIYTRGNMNLDAERVISIVGTRNATEYGRSIVDDLCREFAERKYNILIVSGLAYGIDVQAHRCALNYKLPTVGVIAHGLDTLYPAVHKQTAQKMQECGGIVTDFPSNTKIDPANFIKRNRIIAGLADATIVVESAQKGGSLITADIASSYNRDVFAFPGRAGDTYSKGCNLLIRNNGATLVEGINDLEYFMGWKKTDKVDAIQSSLFIDLNPDEEKVVDLLKEKGELFIDQISAEIKLPVSRISAMLLNLEFKNLVLALPGKMYKLR